ncbi:hypothetical protein DFR57_111116 [Saliterribacillus persicus]|uniref:Competence protein ComGE n=1 Tax=Saliterribacillus persicus TaxID=930114 RepID=A0A368XBN6_9BACI|nr:hypothetical protein DFR57_111116 [Saliterribacillus persicus]
MIILLRFHLERADVTLKNQNESGYLLLEAVFSITLLFSILFTFIPMNYQILKEYKDLEIKREVALELSNQLKLSSDNTTIRKNIITKDSYEITYTFNQQNNILEGCATWIDTKEIIQDICFYYPNQ